MNRFTWARLAVVAGMASVALGAAAEDRRVGDWSVGVLKGNAGAYAATVNDSGGLLGQYCYREQGACVWLVANDAACEAGNRYRVLVNSDSGAASLEVLCVNLEGKTRFAFTDFEAIDAIVRNARRLGLAFPMENGHFQITRFSLDGAARAVAIMREVAEAMTARRSNATTGFTF